MTPGTMQVAAFKENHYPDAGAIVYCIAFYIEDEALGHLGRLGDFTLLVCVWL
jgi:hypothetical protein